MRTTVEFGADVAQAIEQLRRERGLGVSEAVNELIRRGLLLRPEPNRFRQRTAPLGIRVDVSNIADALDGLDGALAR